MRTPAAMPSAAYIVSTEVPPYDQKRQRQAHDRQQTDIHEDVHERLKQEALRATPTASSEENGVDAR